MRLNIRETYSVCAEGSRLYRFINDVRHSEIACAEQYCGGDVFHCRISAVDLKKLQHLAEKNGITLTLQEHPSLVGRIRRYRLRLGIPLGLLLCAGIIFYFSNTVATIEIRGNEAVSDGVILAVLESCGITEGEWIADIDFTRCERKLRAAVPDLAWVGIRHTGNRLVVEVSEATPPPEMLDERTPCNIVSLYDAQITGIRVYNGHLVRLMGDGVAAGDMIVSGVFEDEKGHVTYHHAIAEIRGIYEKEAELSEYFTVTEREETGEVFRRRYFRLFSLKIPLTFGNCSFSEYTETKTYTPFSFLQHELPFGIIQETYSEYQSEIIVRTEEETQLALNASIVRYEKNFLQDVEILERRVSYTSDGSGMSCRIIYTVEGEIGKTSDIFVK